MIDNRSEAGGLRGIAVLAVVLFHAGAAILPGGALGIDVALVVTGYLATSAILAGQRNGDFGLAAFYGERVRRFLPPLLVVLAATLALAVLWLPPSGQDAFAESLLASLLFYSNLLFWSRAHDLALGAGAEPLLHTWALAVCGQFLLVLPILLLLLRRVAPRIRLGVLATLFALSLLLWAFVAWRAPAATFFLLPTRAWELLAGAMLACVGVRRLRAPWPAAVAPFGLGMVLASFVLSGMTAPSATAWSLVAVAGTVLILAFGTPGSRVGRLLAAPPLKLLGRISLSVYLWHWPILVFARLRLGEALSAPALVGLVALSLLLGYGTWRFVERPARERGLSALSSVASALALVALAQVPSLRVGNDPRPTTLAVRLTPPEIEAKLASNPGLSADCDGEFTLSPRCRTSEEPEVLLWGDSYAMHLAPAIAAGAGAAGMIQHTKSACMAAAGISVIGPDFPERWAQGCIDFNDQVLDWLKSQPSVQVVVVSSPLGLIEWDVYRRDGLIARGPRPDLVRAALVDTAERVRAMGKDFVIVSPTPVSGSDLGECLVTAALQGGPEGACDFPWSRGQAAAFGFLEDISRDIPVVFLDELLCGCGACSSRVGDILIYRGFGGLSLEGARYLETGLGLYPRIRSAADQ